MKNTFTMLLLCAALILTHCRPDNAAAQRAQPGFKGIVTDTLLIDSQQYFEYALPQGSHFDFTLKRPSKTDTTVLLCVAAAFTRLDNGGVDGLYAVKGKTGGAISNRLGGGCVLLPPHNPLIAGTRDGTALTKGWIDSTIVKKKAGYFQQLQLVRDAKALRYGKDQSLFQRRALVTYAYKPAAIIESASEITLQQFADALAKTGAQDALYLDMGGWDEGWIRTGRTQCTRIGLMCTQTARQSNWLIIVRK
ncbi:MAG: hypothetical protein MUC87_07890 [Bacteroidia bacterium]|jgi:hypothetical protein|nr:hypothetical protein [Bacteroidia bacterium]